MVDGTGSKGESRYLPPPRVVMMLTLNRRPVCPSIRLPDGRLALLYARRCWARLAPFCVMMPRPEATSASIGGLESAWLGGW